MRAIEFTCRGFLPAPAESICARIADVDRWKDFAGYGPIPGIARAEYEHKSEGMVGSRIRVQNNDGSTHTEEFLEWHPDQRVRMRLQDFSAPLGKIAICFEEEWVFTPASGGTAVVRRFSLVPRNRAGWVALALVAPLLRRAVHRHFDQLQAAAHG